MDEQTERFITGLKSVEEVGPAIVEVVVSLRNGSSARLRMNASTYEEFVAKFIQVPKNGLLARLFGRG